MVERPLDVGKARGSNPLSRTMKKERLHFNLILLGMIASGKDTQAEILLKKYSFQPVESGKYWRKMAKSKTKDGELLRKTTNKGLPAPVKLMKQFLITHIDKKTKSKDLLFVGNPRLKPEAQLLKKIMDSKKLPFFALYITLPEKDVYKRSQSRMRNADDALYVKQRVKWHKDQVSKTVSYFKSNKKLITIDGRKSIEDVSKDIEKAISKIKKEFNQ